MKFSFCRLIVILVWMGLLATPWPLFARKTPEVMLEKVAEKCKGLIPDKHVVVKVARFNVSTKSVQVTDELIDALGKNPTSQD